MIKRLIRNWLFEEQTIASCKSPNVSSESLVEHDATHLYIFPAIGGKIIEFRRYDHVKDKQHTSRYIIKDDDEFSDKLSKIITMENLKY